MSDLAQRLMRIDEAATQSSSARAIFGSMSDMQRSIASSTPPLRIGMWPCTSDDDPITAMGIWAMLAYLLERWQDVRVYRLFVQLSGEPDSFQWSIEESQFEIDDWYVEQLDENIALWGTLKQENDKWTLTASIENDLLIADDDADDVQEAQLQATSIQELVAQLPSFAEEIAMLIDAERLDEMIPVYNTQSVGQVEKLFETLLQWEANLLLHLWGQEWDDPAVLAAQQRMVSEAEKVDTDAAAWVVSQAVGQTMRPGYSIIGDLLVDKVPDVIERFPHTSTPALILAPYVYRMGQASKALELLEDERQRNASPLVWVRLADLLTLGGQVTQAVDRLQTAIEQSVVDNFLYRYYGNLLAIVQRQDVPIASLVLTEASDPTYEALSEEIIAAYDEALSLVPKDIEALHAKLLHMDTSLVAESAIWENFAQLVQIDDDGERVRDVISGFYDLDDVTPGVQAIEARSDDELSFTWLLNISALYLTQDSRKQAISYIERAIDRADSIAGLADAERLRLIAQHDMFEYRFGEVTSIVDAGNRLSSNDVEFLEAIVNEAPHLVDGHLALAKAYANWGDADAALEVLLDANEVLANDPDILALLAKYLWESDERTLAFDYLNQGIAHAPNHLPLLTRTARYLFDTGQLEQAREYLAHAESVAPRSPLLKAVRTYIANRINENPDAYR